MSSEEKEEMVEAEGGKDSEQQISGITFVYLVGVGFQIFVLLFIFAKRQIMRFAWNSRREPHVPIGSGAANWMNKRIADNIAALNSFKYEARLDPSSFPAHGKLQPRLKAVAEFQQIKDSAREIGLDLNGPSLFVALVSAKESLMSGMNDSQLARITVLYELARHSPQPFTEENYEELKELCKLFRRNMVLQSSSARKQAAENGKEITVSWKNSKTRNRKQKTSETMV